MRLTKDVIVRCALAGMFVAVPTDHAGERALVVGGGDSAVEAALALSEVAEVTKPAGWWTGNEVRYDTLVELPPEGGLRPGMSAEVEVLIAEYENVLTIPVAAVRH